MHARRNDLGLSRVDENPHKRGGKGADQHADDDAEHRACQPGTANPLFDAVRLACPVILGHIGREGVAKILHRHIGKGIDLHRCRKSRHDDRAEAVDQTLHHQDAKIHNGLLNAGHHREIQDIGKVLPVPPAVCPFRAELRELFQGVQADAHAGHILGKDSRPGGTLHAPVKHKDTDQIQDHIQDGRHGQKRQRHHGIADGPQKVCEIVIQKGGRNAQKDDEQVVLHQRAKLCGHPQHPQNAVQTQIDQQVEHQGDARNKQEGLEHALPHLLGLAAAVLHGHSRAAAHAQAQQDRGEEGHQGVGGPHRRQRIRAEEAAHHPSVGNVVHLLQQVAEHQRQGKQQDILCNGSLGQTVLHGVIFSYSYLRHFSRILRGIPWVCSA